MTDQVRLGIFGAGQAYRQLYAPAIALRPELTVAGTADPGAKADYRSPGELLDAVELQGVIILSPARVHAEQVRLVTERGIPVLVEKPPAVSAAEVDSWMRPELVTPAFSRRYWRSYRDQRPECRRFDFNLETNPNTWGAQSVESPVRDLLPHAADLAVWLSGSEITSVVEVSRTAVRASGAFLLANGARFDWHVAHGAAYRETLTCDGKEIAFAGIGPARRAHAASEAPAHGTRRRNRRDACRLGGVVRWKPAKVTSRCRCRALLRRRHRDGGRRTISHPRMNSPKVSVIIPVRTDRRIFATVDSILSVAAEPESLEIIIVDNASTPEFSSELQERLGERATILQEAEAGVYRARNRAIDVATGEFVFFTDADCIIRPGWIDAGLKELESADIVQGYSGSVGDGKVQRLIQRRYEAHLRKLPAGRPTECDTRNLAMRRTVFETLRFEERYRRVGDTEFGLRAEAAGFRVAYQPAMRVEHEHEPDLALFAAKQACHGWGAQRLMQQHPEVEWHGGHLKTVSRLSKRLEPRRGAGLVAGLCIRGAVLNARILERLAPRLPEVLGFWWLTAIDKLAALGGHLSYRPSEARAVTV